MATVYKKFTKTEIDTREITSADASTKTSVNTILSNFISYFKLKHL